MTHPAQEISREMRNFIIFPCVPVSKVSMASGDGAGLDISRNKGILMVMGSALCFSVNGLICKMCEDRGYPSFQVAFVRSWVQMLGSMAIALNRKDEFAPNVRVWGLMMTRGVFDAGAMMMGYYSFTRLSLGDANTLLFTNPVFVGPLAYFILGEVYGVFDGVASLTCLLGVLMVSQPPAIFTHFGMGPKEEGGGDDAVGVIVDLVASVCIGVVYVVIRLVGKRASPFVQVFYGGLNGLLGSTVLMFATQNPRWPSSPVHALMLVGVGAFAITAQTLMTVGMQSVPAGQASVIRNLDIVFAYIWEVLFLNSHPTALTLGGAGVIIASLIALNTVRARREKAAVAAGSADGEGEERRSSMRSSKGGGGAAGANTGGGEGGDGGGGTATMDAVESGWGKKTVNSWEVAPSRFSSCLVVVGEEAPEQGGEQQQPQEEKEEVPHGRYKGEEGMLTEPLLQSHQHQN